MRRLGLLLLLFACSTPHMVDLEKKQPVQCAPAQMVVLPECVTLSGKSLVEVLGTDPRCIVMSADHRFSDAPPEECASLILGHPYCAVWKEGQ